MNVIKGNIFEILNGSKQFILPIYQRNYSWDIEQCETLWNDIVKMQQCNKKSHFVGSIVNIAEQAMPTGVQKFMLIDGQQRLTTLSLLLIALRNFAQAHPDNVTINPRRIDSAMLQNMDESGVEKYKLLLTGSDRDIFFTLINHQESELKECYSKLLDNYRFFTKKVEESAISLDKIYEATGKLLIVNITLERDADDPQAIFESLNSTGKGLSASDLIRNYVLMGLPQKQQTEIYEKLWRPMENLFEYERQSEIQDRFLRDYLTMKLARIPRQNRLYEEFKRYASDKQFDVIQALCLDIKEYAKYYTDIVFKRHNNSEIKSLYEDISELRMEVAYPFLLLVHHDHAINKISEKELIEIIKLCINYVFRRSICDIPTNSLNKTFASMKNAIREDDYLNSIKAFFVLRESYKEFPNDEKFTHAFKTRDIYHTRNLCFILRHLENANNKAPICMGNYTIEHIMPQNPNLSTEWKLELGEDWKEIQKSRLHTIGNLTLTAYNSEMSDKPFIKKKEMRGGFIESALRINSYVVKQSKWSASQIDERAEILTQQAIQIWGYPYCDASILQQYTQIHNDDSTYDLQDYSFNTLTSELFTTLDRNIKNLSPDVKRECKKLYIAYKLETNFIDIIVQQKGLKLIINLKFNEIHDPLHICHDISGTGCWGNGDVCVYFTDNAQIENVIDIVRQSYDKQVESAES